MEWKNFSEEKPKHKALVLCWNGKMTLRKQRPESPRTFSRGMNGLKILHKFKHFIRKISTFFKKSPLKFDFLIFYKTERKTHSSL